MTISKNIRYALAVAFFTAIALVAFTPSAQAETSSVDGLLKQIQALNAQIKELQGKLAGLHKDNQELRMELRAELKEGVTDEDIKKIQEILASDPDIYPRGLVTGYFGPLTTDALKRFQQRFELKATGQLDEETREYLEDLLKERYNGKVPPGLLRAPGIAKKVELRIREGCDDNRRLAFLCQKLKDKYGHNDDDDANDDDDEGELEIEVEFEDGDAHVKITYENGKKKMLTLDNMDEEDEIIDEIVKLTGLSKEDVEDAIEFGDNPGDIDEINVVIDNDEARVTVKYDDGDSDLYIYDSTSESEIIDLVADELDMDKEDIEDIIEFDDEDDDEIESIKVEFDSDDSEVTVEYGDNTTETFDIDNVTRHNDVIEAIAEELDIEEDEVRDVIEFVDGDLTIDVRVEDDEAEVDITYENGDSEGFTLDMTDENEIIAEIADRTDLTEEEVEEVIEFDIED